MDALGAVLRLMDAGLKVISALDMCREVALFIRYGSGAWTRQRRIARWKAKKEHQK